MSDNSDTNMPGTTHTPVVYEEEPVTWEYKCIKKELGDQDRMNEEELNSLGQEGWELVQVIHDENVLRYYFKRQFQ